MAKGLKRSEQSGAKKPKRVSLRRLFYLTALLIFLLFLLIPKVRSAWASFYEGFAESEAPVVKFVKPPKGIGKKQIRVKVRVSDLHSGLDKVTARILQGSKRVKVFDRKYEKKKNNDTFHIEFAGSEIGLREGTATVSVTAYDRALWSTSTEAKLELVVDYTRPRISVFTTQHNATRGGVELVFYKVRAKDEVVSGVEVGGIMFPGFSAVELDEGFASEPDLYFAFFAVPLDFEREESVDASIRVFARDAVGNLAYSSIFYRVRELRFRSQKQEVSMQHLKGRVENLYREYLILESKLSALPPKEYQAAQSEEELIERFKVVNTDFRALSEKVLLPIFARPIQKRYWRDEFSRPGGSWLPGVFGDRVEFYLGERELGGYRRGGMRYSAKSGTEVKAVHDGIVIFADNLGVFGQTLVLDHGFGLTSMYYFLSSISRFEGDLVKKEGVLGIAGNTGFVAASRIGFEYRMHGIPVRPEEWWDDTWIKGHITNKINRVKKLLGIQVRIEPQL